MALGDTLRTSLCTHNRGDGMACNRLALHTVETHEEGRLVQTLNACGFCASYLTIRARLDESFGVNIKPKRGRKPIIGQLGTESEAEKGLQAAMDAKDEWAVSFWLNVIHESKQPIMVEEVDY